jgi:hypothetical protein
VAFVFWNGWSIGPFALCPAFPDSLGGRDSTDYYGPAVPAETLAAYLPTYYEELQQVPALLAEHFICQLEVPFRSPWAWRARLGSSPVGCVVLQAPLDTHAMQGI